MRCACLYDLMSHSALLEASLYLTAGHGNMAFSLRLELKEEEAGAV